MEENGGLLFSRPEASGAQYMWRLAAPAVFLMVGIIAGFVLTSRDLLRAFSAGRATEPVQSEDLDVPTVKELELSPVASDPEASQPPTTKSRQGSLSSAVSAEDDKDAKGGGGGDAAAEEPKKSKPKSGNESKEMLDFRHLMVKGLELKKYKGPNQLPEKCVIYMDVTCRTFFCAKQKNSPSAKAHPVELIEGVQAAEMDKIICLVHREGQLDLEVSSPKVRDYLVRMLNKLFAIEKEKASSKGGKRGGGSGKPTKAARPGASRDSGSGSMGMGGRPGMVSQVRLLAQHCYTLQDEKIEALVTAKIPTHSRWESYQEFKDKINRRDELIRALQDALGTINAERVRFQRACEDVESHHQDELQELKQHLAMALTSFQELQRASEHRESEMREALRGAVERSSKFENEKAALLESMNDQKSNAAVALKEVEMLREAVQKQQGEIATKTQEFEDARKRFSQVKEALTVERNLRARAEIKEEQMRQETIAITGQMHAIRNKMTGEVQVSSKELEDKTAELQATIKEMEDSKKENDTLLEEERKKCTILTGEVLSLKESLESKSSEASKLATLAEKAGQVDGLLADVERLQKELEDTSGASTKKMEEMQAIIDEKEAKILEGDEIRRKMHNTIQELRGNIRVYVRVRPFLPGDGVDLEADNKPTTTCKNDGVTAEIVKLDDTGSIEDSHSWEFDKTFAGADGQEEIFTEVSEFVQSALDGYNVCLFSYGQTGSGKTHTMQGSGHGEQRGIIPRAIEQIGVYRELMKPKGWVYQMHVTFIEIYNEIVYDLLREETAEKNELDIKQDTKGKTYVHGANMVLVDPTDKQQIDDLMDTAALHRATSSTNMNAQSSRSHSVFTLHLQGVNDEQGARIKGQLHLCDLAGSERIARSGAEGDRLKEAININKSLSCLTDVFNSLAQKQAYIPFRNSKLTYLLQPALSGDGKTMMFVNLSPTNESYFESLCSLRFASNVNQVELGKAVKNVSEMSAKELEKRKKGEKDDKSPPRPTMNKRGNTPPPPGTGGGKNKAGAGRGMKGSKTMR
mmetsp:Transcript_14640/g.25801  ORF Transcript_14640/g.25801 Transcript_14640/m.25801 type:complete len:1036 (-) Transcript_14640:556-3663(-)